MKRGNKKNVPDLTGDYVKIGVTTCRGCAFSSDKPTISGAKIRCAHSSKPRVIFHPEHGWICYSFSKRMLGRNVNNE